MFLRLVFYIKIVFFLNFQRINIVTKYIYVDRYGSDQILGILQVSRTQVISTCVDLCLCLRSLTASFNCSEHFRAVSFLNFPKSI